MVRIIHVKFRTTLMSSEIQNSHTGPKYLSAIVHTQYVLIDRRAAPDVLDDIV
jgi:hypothetical protein